MPKSNGPRCKTRNKFKRDTRQVKPTPNSMVKELAPDTKVNIHVESSVHSGMPFRRFIGKTGTIMSKRGSCYLVKFKDSNAEKTIIVHPAHLKIQG